MTADYLDILSKRLGVRIEAHTDLIWPEVLGKAKLHELDMVSCAAGVKKM